MKITVTAIVISAMLCGHLMAVDYYVSNSGSDPANTGLSAASPFQTIQKAASIMSAGDNCYIAGGVYRETVIPARSGAAGAPITFLPYMNQPVTITGADIVSGPWSVYSGNIYKSADTSNFNQLFVDSVMMNKARWPNTAAGDLLHMVTATASAGTNYSALNDPSLPPGNWNGAYVWIQPGDGWGAYVTQITNYTAGSGFTFSTPISTSGDTNYEPRAGNPYYIFGALAGLDTNSEWVLDTAGQVLYLWTPDGAAPSAHVVEFKNRIYAFDLTGLSYIKLYNLNIFSAAVNMNGSYYCVVDDCRMKYVDHYESMSGFTTGGGETNYVSGGYNTYSNCEISQSAGCGIYIQGYDNTVTNCLIHDTGYMGSNHAAIMTEGSPGSPAFGDVLSHNTIYNTGRFGIYHPSTTQEKILYNDISEPGLLSKDCGPIYSFGLDAQYTEIAYNWVHDNYTKYGAGIYLDNGTNNHLVHHNVAWNLAGTGIVLNTPSENNRIYNNTLFNCLNSFSYYGNAAQGLGDIQDQSGTIVENNLADMSTASFCTKYPPVVSNNGLYPVDSNYVPTSGSGAIDAGLVIPGITDGYAGAAPDIGAYEYGGTYFKPGYVPPSPTVTAGGPAYTASVSPTFSATPTVTATYPAYPVNLIDDFSGCTATNALGGIWFSYNDSGSGGSSTVAIAVSTPGYPASSCALNVTGAVRYAAGGYNSPYIAFGTGLVSDRDYSSCLGVYFYFNGDNRYYNIRLVADSAINTGYNDYKYSFFAPSGWQYYLIPFTSFTQAAGWGVTVSPGTVLSRVNQIVFQNGVYPPPGSQYPVNVSLGPIGIYGCGMAAPTFTPTPAPLIPGSLIDNCDHPGNVNLWNGAWYTTNDSAQAPAGLSQVWPPAGQFTMTAPGFDSTGSAARMTGTVINTTGYYQYPFVAMGTNFGGIRDISSCSSLRFWYKNDMKQYYTKIACDSSIPTGYNYYRYTLPPSSTWTLINIPFSSMTQASGWGVTASVSVYFTKTTAVEFQTDSFPATGTQWNVDLWVDNPEICGCPGIGTVTPTPVVTATFTFTITKTPSPVESPTATMTLTPEKTAASNLDSLYFYPNPYNISNAQKPGITFNNLTAHTKIAVYNLDGEEVYSDERDTPDGIYFWRLSGLPNSRTLSPGIYIYLIEGLNCRKTGKLAIIR